MINIDYDVDPKSFVINLDTPVQGGLNPSVLYQIKKI